MRSEGFGSFNSAIDPLRIFPLPTQNPCFQRRALCWRAQKGLLRMRKDWWVVADGDGNPIALLLGCSRSSEALRIAGSFFPDAAKLTVIEWRVAANGQRRAAKQAFHITPRMCARLQVMPPSPPPSPIELAAEQLRR